MKSICQHCGESMEVQRSTKKYCSSRCRVAASREVDKVEDAWGRLAQAMSDLATLSTDGEHDYNATYALINARGLLNWYQRPSMLQWWHCDNCKQSVRVEVPEDKHCSCKKPNWRRLNS